jgi:hypothetical protein
VGAPRIARQERTRLTDDAADDDAIATTATTAGS